MKRESKTRSKLKIGMLLILIAIILLIIIKPEEKQMNGKSIYKSPEGKKEIAGFYEAALKQWPVDHEEMQIPTRYGTTFVIASGKRSAPPMILLHGTGSNSAMWMGDIKDFSKSYRVYAVDIIGDPGKSDENRPDLNGPAHSDWMEDVMSHLKIKEAVFVGNSLGGWMSLKFAAANPDRVEKLVLLAPSGIAPARKSFIIKAIPLMLMGKWGLEKMNKIVYYKEEVPEEVNRFGAMIFKHFNYRMEEIPVFSDEELKKLAMPVLLMNGEKDALLRSPETTARIKSLLPHADARMLPDTGHVLINLSGEIMRFLSV
ncbi:MAG: alpha/beta hydrolase [bacterium]|nr:alpha/beta hydrolase [bacterium]